MSQGTQRTASLLVSFLCVYLLQHKLLMLLQKDVQQHCCKLMENATLQYLQGLLVHAAERSEHTTLSSVVEEHVEP